MHIHNLGVVYGKVSLDIADNQPECDFLCCHIFPDNLAVASNHIVSLYECILPLPVFWRKRLTQYE